MIVSAKIASHPGIIGDAGNKWRAGINGHRISSGKNAHIERCIARGGRYLIRLPVDQGRSGIVKTPGARTICRGRTLRNAIQKHFNCAIRLGCAMKDERDVAGDMIAHRAGIIGYSGNHRRIWRKNIGCGYCANGSIRGNTRQVGCPEGKGTIAGRQ